MIDVAQNLMSLGESIAAAHTASVNDNMTRSHYHDYYELYFLDNGERYHYIDDKLYKTEAGDCIIFPPQTIFKDCTLFQTGHNFIRCPEAEACRLILCIQV